MRFNGLALIRMWLIFKGLRFVLKNFAIFRNISPRLVILHSTTPRWRCISHDKLK